MIRFLSVTVLFMILQSINSKSYSRTFYNSHFNKSQIQYLTKFILPPGSHQVIIETSISTSSGSKQSVPELQFHIDPYKQIEPTCETLTPFFNVKDKYTYQFSTDTIQAYHVIVSDCANNTLNLNIRGIKLTVNVTILDQGSNHFFEKNVLEHHYPDSEDSVLKLHSYPILALIYVIVWMSSKKTLVSFPIFFSLILGSMHCIWEEAHIIQHDLDGKGRTMMDVFAHMAWAAEDLYISFWFFFMAWGYKVIFWHLEDSEGYYMLSVIIGIMHGIVIGLARLMDDAGNKFHYFEGWVSYVFIITRVCYFWYFRYEVKNNFKNTKDKVRYWGNLVYVFGILYFLGLPAAILSTHFIPDVYQNFYVSVALIITTNLAQLFAFFQIVFKFSAYYKASILSKSLLPNEKGN